MIWPFKRKEAEQPEVKPPVDLNTPVTNPVLKEALAAYKRDPSPDNESNLLHGLMTANYLVPILTDQMKTTPGDKPGQTTIQAGSLIKFMCCYNARNDTLLPAFTDWDEIRAWTKENVSTFVMPSDWIWDFVIRDQRYKGLVINPSGNAWEMSTEILVKLQKQQRNTQPGH